MKILGIETSCDETAASVVELVGIESQTPSQLDAGQQAGMVCRLLSNVVASSMDLHAAYGGVVPEIAARSHIESIMPVIEQSLAEANCDWEEIDGLAVTYGAGLGGSLLIGVLTARTLAIIKNKPLYAINHVEGHVYANFITCAGSGMPASERSTEHREPSLRDAALQAPLLNQRNNITALSAARLRLASHQSPAQVQEWKLGNQTYALPGSQPLFPMLALIVSGGHSQLVIFRNHFDYTLLGQTHDDAIGEAFDKVARVIGLPYPGGVSIEKAAPGGNAKAFNFPKAKLQAKYDFSFSGIKTAVLRAAQEAIGKDFNFPSHQIAEKLTEKQRLDIAASFQRVAIETVVDKTVLAYEEFQPKSVVIGGGVASSQELRRQLEKRLGEVIERSQGVRLDAGLGSAEEAQRAVQKSTVSEHHRPATTSSAENTGGLGGYADNQASVAQILRYTDRKLCTDNGAMIATLGCFKAMHNQPTADPYKLAIEPNLSM